MTSFMASAMTDFQQPGLEMKDKTQGGKRQKYTPRACNSCQQRKVKCSGEPICSHCQNRDVECVYAAANEDGKLRKPRRRKNRTQQRRPQTSVQASPPPSQNSIGCGHRRSTSTGESHGVLDSTPSPTTANRAARHGSASSIAAASAHSRGAGSVTALDVDSPDSGELDAFQSSSPWSGTLAVSSQIRALRLSAGDSLDFLQEAIFKSRDKVVVTLPAPRDLSALIGVFFREFNCYFPCLHHQNAQRVLSESLRQLGYFDSVRDISVPVTHYKTVAILFNIIAFAEPFSTLTWDRPRPGREAYVQGRKVMQHFEGCTRDDLNDVIYHVLSAAYLFQGESLHRALLHLAQGYQAAMNIRLNDQRHWENQPPGMAYHQSLWWTLHFLDKRVTQRCGMAYLIRESEVAVTEPAANGATGVSDAHANFLQSTVEHSKLWTVIWDNFFAAKALREVPWCDRQVMDAKIVQSQEETPPDLEWRIDLVEHLIRQGEPEVQIRRRLLVYLRCNFLRLCIRHTPLTVQLDDMQRRRSSFVIASKSIDAMAKYMSLYTKYQPNGFVLTSSLVECIYYVAPEMLDQPDLVSAEARRKKLQEAVDLLRRLSRTVGAAKRAFEAIDCIMGESEGPTGLVPVGSFRQWNIGRRSPVPDKPPSSQDDMVDSQLQLPAAPAMSALTERPCFETLDFEFQETTPRPDYQGDALAGTKSMAGSGSANPTRGPVGQDPMEQDFDFFFTAGFEIPPLEFYKPYPSRF